MFKKLSLIAMLFFAYSVTYSQSKGVEFSKSDNWQSYKRADNYEISYKTSSCDLKNDGISKEEVYLKIENFSSDTIVLDYKLELVYGERCFNCDGLNDELNIHLILLPNQIIEGACGDENKYRLRVFSKFHTRESNTTLTNFALKNILSTQN